jgi:hypothetical protein
MVSRSLPQWLTRFSGILDWTLFGTPSTTLSGGDFDLLNKLINLVVIALGAAVAAKLAQLYHFNEIWLELSVVVVSALQLVFDFGGSARVQEFLQQRYYDALP